MAIGGLHRTTAKRVAFTAAGILVGVCGIVAGTVRDPGGEPVRESTAARITHTAAIPGGLEFRRLADPARTVVTDGAGRTVVTDGAGRVVAMLTDGARTANVLGPSRTFAEPSTTSASVTTEVWVRILPQPWTAAAQDAPWFRGWLDSAMRDRQPDVLSAATQYLTGSVQLADVAGRRYGGDARFGKVDVNADGRLERSDFYDYLGVPWTFPDGRVEVSDPAVKGAIDDSGFVRLVFGYRSGMPLRAGNDQPSDAIPRGTNAIATAAPGAVVVPDRRLPVSDFGRLQPGDLVFFDVDPDRQLDHVGIYLGVDDDGHHRFVASRKAADGPTMGDAGGLAVLDGGGDYAASFRSVKRL